MPSVQPGKTRYTIERDLIEPTSRFLAEVGQAGYEAVAVWIGRLEPRDEAVCERAYAPEQIPYRGPEGVSVRIPERAITELIRELGPDERVLLRVHSHPRAAYHSEMDNMNMLISHAGAISLVVGSFAEHGIDLESCSINELQVDGTWRELDIAEVRLRFRIR
jgi:hypothetical protein